MAQSGHRSFHSADMEDQVALLTRTDSVPRRARGLRWKGFVTGRQFSHDDALVTCAAWNFSGDVVLTGDDAAKLRC